MRWKNKHNTPKVGDIREKFPFAWLPTTAGKYTVWLERYWVKQQLTVTFALDEGHVYPVEEWVEIDRDVATYYP